jgi:hypothetical protein
LNSLIVGDAPPNADEIAFALGLSAGVRGGVARCGPLGLA